MPKKEESNKNANVLGASGLNGKTVTGFNIWRTGIIDVLEISFSGGSGPTFIKLRQGQVDVGGTADWGSGTMQ